MAGARPKKKMKKKARRHDLGRFRALKVKEEELDYKNVALLQRLVSAQGKLFSRKRTGLSAEHQRRIALELKRARFLGLMPYVT